MNKELIDKAWACLPREFKEEVKRLYRIADSDVDQMIAMIMLENVFGHHNLTSYTEVEEMLTVSRKKVQEEYAIISEELSYHDAGTKDYTAWHYIKMIFEEFFGSKCLSDRLSEVKRDLSEPKEDKHFYNIFKDSFREHNRLHIAAQIVAAIYANYQAAKGFKSIEELVRKALDIADTLIKESEKGGVE